MQDKGKKLNDLERLKFEVVQEFGIDASGKPKDGKKKIKKS
jgi:hypothetical protein